MNNGLLVHGQGNQCGSVGVWEASLFVRLLLAPPGSSRLLLAPPALHPPLASAVRPWGARAVLRPEHSRDWGWTSKFKWPLLGPHAPTYKLRRLHASMQAYAGVCATLRDMGGLVASRLHDRMQAYAGVCVCVCACTLPARTNETAESPESHDPNSYQNHDFDGLSGGYGAHEFLAQT